MSMFMTFQNRTSIGVILTTAVVGCSVGPRYERPGVQTPVAYKELTPADYKKTEGWKAAQPKDDALRGNWWEIFKDPELNALEEKVNSSNQSIAAIAASYFAARAIVREDQAQLLPTVTTNPSVTWERSSTTVGAGAGAAASPSNGAKPSVVYSLPVNATWQPDLFGTVRNTIRAAAYGAQATAADVVNTRLTVQSEVASDYFLLRGQDALKELLAATVVAYKESLELTKAQFETGIGTDEAVAQAETQYAATQAQMTALGIQRAQYEHAIAMLTGQMASTFSIPVEPLKATPPAIPFGLPSQLLERRPDIAASERSTAQANAQIGVGTAAFFPTLSLTGSAGFESSSIGKLFSWPSFFFSLGPALAQVIFDGGLRQATVDQYKAQYDQAAANYRQTVLTAFQQVEDGLATLRILSVQLQQEDAAVKSAERTLSIAKDRYLLGIDPYLNVITAQVSLLTNQEADINLHIMQMTASVALIQALGGGWDVSELAGPEVTSSAP